MELTGPVIGLLAVGLVFGLVIAFAYALARYGSRRMADPRRRGRFVPLLPWWHLGGQPGLPNGDQENGRRGR